MSIVTSWNLPCHGHSSHVHSTCNRNLEGTPALKNGKNILGLKSGKRQRSLHLLFYTIRLLAQQTASGRIYCDRRCEKTFMAYVSTTLYRALLSTQRTRFGQSRFYHKRSMTSRSNRKRNTFARYPSHLDLNNRENLKKGNFISYPTVPLSTMTLVDVGFISLH